MSIIVQNAVDKDLEIVLVAGIIMRYPKEYEEGKIVAIGGIGEKVSAAVEKGCDTIIIPKSNLDYYTEVPLSVRAKVENLHEIESYKDLEKLLTAGL
ncbi:19475_t:CDS:2 [Funneliformis geosporum]|uniref:19475_t:CDS:1 n=1 Tax=Funneliformis geosporum TaxID=1117311 RepID=A0A9W4SZG4_9GLOM|nr:19475_t:CDS:2 [Funneliformis geosporum]